MSELTPAQQIIKTIAQIQHDQTTLDALIAPPGEQTNAIRDPLNDDTYCTELIKTYHINVRFVRNGIECACQHDDGQQGPVVFGPGYNETVCLALIADHQARQLDSAPQTPLCQCEHVCGDDPTLYHSKGKRRCHRLNNNAVPKAGLLDRLFMRIAS